MADDPKILVSTDWLGQRLGDPGIRILDASWYLPAMQRDAYSEYCAGHIPGAMFFDIDAVSDPDSDLPHMVPNSGHFEQAVAALGISNGDQVVVYDGAGLFSAARVWWLLRHMGHDTVAVLDGGLPKWTVEGRPVTDDQSDVVAGQFKAKPQATLLRDVAQVLDVINSGSAQIADARGAARFKGEAAEPRAGLRSGHMPGARNIPFDAVLTEGGQMRPVAQLADIFKAAGIDLTQPVITSCGSGVTAAVLTLALTRLGHSENALYDGSWAEWGGEPALPIATGES